MPARRRLATAVVVASLVVVSWTVPAGAQQTPAVSSDPVAELVGATDGPVEVERDDTGTVTALVSQDGGAVLDTDASTPRAAVRELLSEHGEAFGVEGDRSSATVGAVLPSATGGAVVRAEQRVAGLPVFGGQVVTVLDEDDDVVSVAAATADGDVAVPAPRTTSEQALATARRAVAEAARTDVADLRAEPVARVLFDPALVGDDGPGGVRPVWRVEVSGPTVRQTVLVGTDAGEVALRLDERAHLTSRRVCDNDSAPGDPATDVPVCRVAARAEGGAETGVAEVDAAYDHLGETAAAFAALKPGLDLSSMLGGLKATVRWCEDGEACNPYPNAFWDGTQVVLGDGFAAADDVVAHELTHGYVDTTAHLFYHQQSGALNEAFADLLGEIVDRRSGTDTDTRWQLGEDLTGPLAGFRRDIADPPRNRSRIRGRGPVAMPDRMTSPGWVDESGSAGDDHGGVHHNMGVGLKTGYLVSQGGTFNGHTVQGIDAGDPSLAKTGLLLLELIPTLTSGADYADLGTALVATCDRLAATATRGFTAADCAEVTQAVAATELGSPPAVGEQPVQVSASCPTGSTQTLLARDDDGVPDLFEARTSRSSWFRLSAGSSVQYSVSGAQSVFLPDPRTAGEVVSVQTRELTLPAGRSAVTLHFHHAWSFARAPHDGGRVVVERQVGPGAWEVVAPLSWDNGPRQVVDAPSGRFTGFGGDSRGWGSSRLDLTSLAGQVVRLRFEVAGDATPDGYGWWLDDVRVYACGTPAPTPAPAPTPSATPAPVAPAPVASAPVVRRAVTASVASSTTKVRRGKAVVVKGRAVVRGTATAVRGVRMTLQQRSVGSSRWTTVSTRTTDRAGTATWTVKPRRATGYRVLVAAGSTTAAGTSSVRAVGLAPGRR